jgi:non-homologous end joining protein Ku
MAKALIESMAGEWQPAQYENRYQAALMQVIEEKIQKRPPAATRVASPP